MFIVSKMLFPFVNLVLMRKSVERVSSNGCWEDGLVQRCVVKLPLFTRNESTTFFLHLTSGLQGSSHNSPLATTLKLRTLLRKSGDVAVQC